MGNFTAFFNKTDIKNIKSVMSKFIISKAVTISITLIFIFTLNSCGIYKYSDAKKNSTNANDRVKKNMEEGKGFSLSNIGKKGGGDFQFASANPMWRAALNKLSFAPLNNVDYAGGIIVTDWFSEGDTNDQIKITIRFLTNEIRSDALDIIIHKKICKEMYSCKISKIESNLNSEIRIAILKKASQIKSQDAMSSRAKRGPVKLPGKSWK